MSTRPSDLGSIDPDSFGKSLSGIGVNLLVRDVSLSTEFLEKVLGAKVFQPTADFAIITINGQVLQIHADHAYHSHPLPSLLAESGPRGGGVELRLYDVDPDLAASAARARGDIVLQQPTDKPHGLREALILDPDGYAWVPSRRLV